jgi:hypothetical protein
MNYPFNFDLSNALAKLLKHPDVLALQKKHGDLSAQLNAEAVRVVAAERAREVAAFESHIADHVIARLRDRLDAQSKTAAATAAIDFQRKHDLSADYKPQPGNYSLPSHLETIRRGAAFRSVAHAHGYLVEHDAIRTMLEGELKATVADNAAAHLAAFEKAVGDRALADLAAKLEAKRVA